MKTQSKKQFNIHEAKTNLSRLVERVEAGEDLIIGKAGKPVAKLVPFRTERKPRKPGAWRSRVVIQHDFDELPQEVLAAFTGQDK